MSDVEKCRFSILWEWVLTNFVGRVCGAPTQTQPELTTQNVDTQWCAVFYVKPVSVKSTYAERPSPSNPGARPFVVSSLSPLSL